jgi:hypothetical protein
LQKELIWFIFVLVVVLKGGLHRWGNHDNKVGRDETIDIEEVEMDETTYSTR